MAKRRKQTKVSSAMTAQYEDFKQWYILPVAEREDNEKDQQAYAISRGIGRKTLSLWVTIPDFITFLNNHLAKIEERADKVRLVLYNQALAGDVKAIRLFLEYEKSFAQKIKVDGNVVVTGDDIAKAYLKLKEDTK
jgi:hypothetical protein